MNSQQINADWCGHRVDVIGEEARLLLLDKWRREPGKNPETGRKITVGSATYKKLVAKLGCDPHSNNIPSANITADPFLVENMLREQQRRSSVGIGVFMHSNSYNVPQVNQQYASTFTSSDLQGAYVNHIKSAEHAASHLPTVRYSSIVSIPFPAALAACHTHVIPIDGWGC